MMEEEEYQQQTLVLDNGSGEVKAGFAGEDAPRSCFPTLLGWPRHPGLGGVMLGAKKDNYVGHDARKQRGILSLRHPIERGEIADWDDIEKIWHHTFYSELLVAPEQHPILMMTLPATSKADKEKMATVLFETFNCPAVYIANSAVVSLFSTGRTTGTVADSGEGQTHVVSVWEGYALPHYITSMPVAGKDVTQFLMTKLRAEGYPFSTQRDREVVQDIKETTCYVCTNYQQEVQAASLSQSYVREYQLPTGCLPDGATVTLSHNRFECPEIMFQPSMLGYDSPGLHDVIYNCICRCDVDVRRQMFSNMVLAGGNTLFPKMDERLQREVASLAPKGTVVKAVAFPERKYAAWLGGSLLASLRTFPCMWVSKLEYDEFGVHIIHRKY